MKIEVVNENRELELKYKAYCLRYITQDIENIIDSEPLTYEQFCKKHKEDNK